MSKLGVCYYPEHWPEETWPDDARRMRVLGIEIVRIGEFAWSRLEPEPDKQAFDWMQRAMDVLAAEGLKIVLGTPTATPPKWLVDKMPDMLAVDEQGRTRGFGSRRHYCFSHPGYRQECARITTALAKRFGQHPALIAWQTDNEYGCHDTTVSWSPAALAGFRDWLQRKYQSPDALNRAWGNVFWSMEYRDFDEIELPNLTVTEANPSHLMDFRRYTSDQVVAFNKVQTDILRNLSPGRDLVHNYMGRILDFDHFAVGQDLDIASWDSYPLGFLEDRSDMGDGHKRTYARTGDPDFQAFHHDLYRAVGKGRWWVMEQQPGPVNWAPHNPAPLEGMVALWTLEAFAHGAEVVAYFRWRQAPFAQEQMHAGLLLPDSSGATGHGEVAKAFATISELPELPATQQARVAIVFDYPSAWAWEIQPQGQEFDYFALVFDFYRGLRRAGLSVDFVSASDPDLDGYKVVLVPGLFAWNDKLIAAIRSFDGLVLAGPRSGSKTQDFAIPDTLPPGLPSGLLDTRISHVESIRPDSPVAVGPDGSFKYWTEHAIKGDQAEVVVTSETGSPALVRQGNLQYLCGWPDETLMDHVLKTIITDAGGKVLTMPDGVRIRQRGNLLFVMNYGSVSRDLSGLIPGKSLLPGGDTPLPPSGVAVFMLDWSVVQQERRNGAW